MHKKNYTKELVKTLCNATNEKDVENAYWHCFSEYYPSCIGSQNKTDGLLICEDITSLMEFKYNCDLKSKLESAAVVLQSLFYLKRMEKQGKVLPKSIFIGDMDECFCVNIVPPIAKYLVTNDIDWTIAPSKSAAIYPEIVKKIAEDNDINPFIYDVDLKFDFDEVIEKLRSLEKGEGYAITITNENVIEIFKYFTTNVIKDKKYDVNTLFDDFNNRAVMKLSDTFMNCLTDKDSTYLHPKKKNVLVSRGEEIKVDVNLYKSFFSHFKQEYTPKELEVVVANKDRIFEEIYRRRTGAYFTPPIWVKESQKMITECLGENWRDEYIVWDCACGTANMTRDNNFKELYLSTIEEGDINTIKDMGFNRGATIFKYDFLGEVGIDGVPEGLKKAMAEGKKILVYINPPYGTASGNKSKDNVKSNIAVNAVQEEMIKVKYGDAQKQLYTQFLYKIQTLQKKYNCSISIGLFSPTAFLTGCYYKKFRNDFLDNFSLDGGYIMSSTEFSDVGSSWGLSFSVWRTNQSANKNSFIFRLKELNKETFTVNELITKTVYNIADEQDASYWIRSGIKNYSKFDSPQLSSGINVRIDGGGKMCDDAIGYIYCAGNSIQTNNTNISLLSSCFHGDSQGFAFCVNDFNNIVSYFTARKSIMPTWINCKDEYMVPNTEHPDYAQWNNDAIVYALFNNSSQQSSLRDIDYKGKKWDIQNHFFFMSNKEMSELANKHNFNEMYQDAKRFNEDRYVYNLLQTTNLSDDAKEILEMARELIRKSFEMRTTYHAEHPEYHLNTWDAGWAQMKPMLKEYFKSDYNAFVEKYKAFENRMRQGVYTFGFLKE
jgi:hypothetical protein